MDLHPGAPDPGPPDGGDEDGPFYAWLPPEDRLWRHPSEVTPDSRTFTSPSLLGRSGRVMTRVGGLGRLSLVAVVAAVVGALSATGVGVLGGWWGRQTTVVRAVQPATPTVTLADAGGTPTNWRAAEESVAASVVGITVNGPAGPQQGSGLLIAGPDSDQAFIVTDRSLFAPGQAAGDVGPTTVTFLSGVRTTGKLVGTDQITGLAVVEVANVAGDIPAALGSVADLRDADPVLAVGAPSLGGAISVGSVSGEDRSVGLPDGMQMEDLITVTMPPVTAQATGGPLLDQYGRVVGVIINVDPTDTTLQQVTFAVPIDEVTRVASQLMDRDRVTHTWLGVTDAEDVPSVMAHQLGLTGGVEAGQVAAGSPAAQAGIRPGDVLTSLDGKPVTSTGALVSQLQSLDPGRPVSVTYVDSSQTVHTVVRLADRPG